MKKCSRPSAITQMQVQIALRFHLSTVPMAIIRVRITINADKKVGERDPNTALVGMSISPATMSMKNVKRDK